MAAMPRPTSRPRMIPASQTAREVSSDVLALYASRSGAERPTWQSPLHGQTDGQNGHERLVGHGIDDGAHDRLQFPASSNISVDKVCDSGVGEESHGPGVLVVEDEVAYDRGGDEAGEGEDVWDGVDVLVRGQSGEEPVFDLEPARRSEGCRSVLAAMRVSDVRARN